MGKTSIERVGRRDLLRLTGAGAAMLLTKRAYGAEAEPVKKKPNIVLIVADDLGYADIGVHGCRDLPTPHIDSLANNGARCTDAYVSCPVCSPSRAGFLTGRYQQRFGHWYNPGPPAQASPEFGLPLTEVTLADVVKRAGYVTGMVGKWHLGLKPEFHPMKRGFDEFFGFLHGSHSYIDPQADKFNLILRGTQPVDEKAYLTDAFTREAVRFVERHRSSPFFLYLPYNAVHTPMQAPEKYLERFPDIKEEKRRTYAGMLSAMDDGIGKVLDALRAAGVADNTLVIFFSDNGGPPQANASSNTPLRGSKGTVWEGGIRVPMLIQWPGRIPQGTVYKQPVIALDTFATCAAAAGAAVPTDRPIDGVDLVAYLTGRKRDVPHEMLFWKWHDGDVVRKGNWKLLRSSAGSRALYDLSSDIGETKDVAQEHPELVDELTKALEAWESQLRPPLWERGGRQQRRRAAARRGR
jgi:arylsulfatase A-like enzyme